MKRLVFSIAATCLALFAASCGGGGSNVGPPPPPPITGGFSNASLNGQYAFSMSGTDDVGSFFGRIGSIIADGNGRITSGLEDVADFSSGTGTFDFTSGTYSIDSDGRGTLHLVNSTGTTNYSITLGSTTKGYIIQMDSFATAGGSFVKQDPTAFSLPGIAGGYVFDVSGFDNGGVPESIVGRFTADGAGGVTGGVKDENVGGSPSGALSFASASYFPDPAFPADLANFGRGFFTLAGDNFVFYVVDPTRVMLLRTNSPSSPSVFIGEADAQQNVMFTNASLNGSYAFMLGGSRLFGPIATAGRFTADGNGNLSAVTLDENDSGMLTQVTSEGGTYSMDSVGDGRGTATFSTTQGTFTFIVYLMSPTQAVFQETDFSITSDGTVLAQTGEPFTTASLAGDYAFRWNGVTTTDIEDDFVARLTLTNAGVPGGAVDFNIFTNISSAQFFDYPFNGTLTLATDSTGANTLSVTTTPSPRNTFNFTLYIANPQQAFVVSTDNTSVFAGAMSGQQ